MTTNQGTAGQGVGASFTPGPWSFVAETDASNMLHSIYGAADGGDGGLLVARCDQNGEHGDDARLIAAAPELYEALARLLTAVEMTRVLPGSLGQEISAAAHAALAKARGQ